jgi:RNA polymerase-binding protein DksA
VADKMMLIPGRTSKQGTSLNQGKFKDEYKEVTSTLEMNKDDMDKRGLVDGDKVRMWNEIGETIVSCVGKKTEDEDFGFCKSCDIEIGIRRLEARPTADLCIECKTLAEIKERQMAG